MTDYESNDNKIELGNTSSAAETQVLLKEIQPKANFGVRVAPSGANESKQNPLSPIRIDSESVRTNPQKSNDDDWNDVLFSEAPLEETSGNAMEMRSILQGVGNLGSAVTGSVAGFAGTMNNKLQNLFKDKQDEGETGNFGSSSDYKAKYLNQYGVSFTIPSLYVQASTWYPNDPQYFLQVVNYVVPSNDEYEVHTHYMELDKPKMVNRFEDTFKTKITGCTIRLIQTQKDLSSIKMVDDYTFSDLPRIDHLDIKFSIDGSYFVIFSKENNFFRVYPCDQIERILDVVRENKPLFALEGKPDIHDISFGNNTKYIIVKYQLKVEIYHINKAAAQQMSYVPEVFSLPIDQLESIDDFYFHSEILTDEYKCIIACKVYGMKKIKIIDIKDLDNSDIVESDTNTINYFDNLSDDFIVKIKKVANCINLVFVNGSEQFMVELKDNGETNQMKLTQIGSKKIKYVHMDKYNPDNSNCYMFACDDYDDNLHVFRANNIDFHLKIKRDILPNIVKVFDFIETKDGQLKSLSLKDDEFIIDQAYEEEQDCEEAETILSHDHEEDQNHMMQHGKGEHHKTQVFIKKSYIYSSVRAFSINWPYVAFSGLENYILLVNLFDRKQLHRIQFAPLDANVQVQQTFISNTKDLFVVVKENQTFKVLMLDFDKINSNEGAVDENCFKFTEVLSYDGSEVQNQPLTSIFVRGSSRKEVIQLNEKLAIFFLHENQLYGWVQGRDGNREGKVLSPFDVENKNTIISKVLQIRNDNSFYFIQRSTNKQDSVSEICEISIGFSKYNLNVVVKESSLQYDYIAAKIDRTQNKLLILMRELDREIQDKLYLKIVDIDNPLDIFLECEISDSEMKGIFLSGQYKLVDGHVYYQNRVIKLRYDLMKEYGGIGQNQEVYFNKYDDMLALEKGETIKIDSPLDSIQAHRFAYIMLNNECLSCKRLLIIPYLHERRVYLNRMKQNTNYFYTSLQKNLSDNIDKPVWVSYIFAFNLNESKFYVYSEKGLLLNRIEYADYTKKYGEIVSTSPDGLNFALYNRSTDTISIIRFDEEKVSFLKSIKIDQALAQYINIYQHEETQGIFDSEDTEEQEEEKSYEKILDKNHWMLDSNRKSLIYEIQLNNQADILIQITRKNTDSEEAIYFFNANFKINKNTQHSELNESFKEQCKTNIRDFKSDMSEFTRLQGQNLMMLKKKKKFTITNDKIFLWNNFKIEYYFFKQHFCKKNKQKIHFGISKQEKFSFISNVSATDNAETIAIVVENPQCSQVFSWCMQSDIEKKAFEVDKDHEIIWDQQGEFLILSEDKTTLPIQNCNLKCFVHEDFENRNKSVYCDGLKYQQGYRFDFVNHNWVIMKHFIQMSFSYMTFVIQSQFEEIKMTTDEEIDPLLDKAFDLEAFTYMLNKNSCFTSGNLTKDDFMKLQQVLKRLLDHDEVYLEILHYTIVTAAEKKESDNMLMNQFGNLQKQLLGETMSEDHIKSPLHEAYRQGNNRVVDIIIKYMSRININNSEIFKQVLYEVVDLQSFGMYLTNIQTQTSQMLDKKLLKIEEPMNDTIIAMATSHTAYVDDDFFRSQFGEDQNNDLYKVHPVEVLSLKIGWIINTPEGKEFLQAILMRENLDYYDIKSLQIMIEFLYQKSKTLLLTYLLPLYLLQGIIFVLSIIFQELRFQDHEGVKITWISESNLHLLTTIIIVTNQIQTLIMVFIMAKIFSFTGRSFFKRVYTWFDIIFYTLNTIASQLSLTDGVNSQENIRKLQAVGILLFLAKNFYFMKLVDEIAPLIDIIIRIFIDIKWFSFIFFCFIVCFGFAFFLIGQNQIEYDNLTQDEKDSIPYNSIQNSLLFMWNVSLGGGDSSVFELGDGSQETYLRGLYISAQFTMLIHLLNMLIAIMGETFGSRNEVAEQIKIKDHLAFVIDNWYLKDYALGDPKLIKYIITAFHVSEEVEDNEMLESLTSQVGAIQEQVTTVHEEITKRQHNQEISAKRQEINQRMFEKELRLKMAKIEESNQQNNTMLQQLVSKLVD